MTHQLAIWAKLMKGVSCQGKQSETSRTIRNDQIKPSSLQVQLYMPAPWGGQALQTFKLCCEVGRAPRGGANLTLHSGIQLHNSCGLHLSIGMQQRWPGGPTDHQTWTTCFVAPGSSAWLPALCCNATYLSLQPAGQSRFVSSFASLLTRAHLQTQHSLDLCVVLCCG